MTNSEKRYSEALKGINELLKNANGILRLPTEVKTALKNTTNLELKIVLLEATKKMLKEMHNTAGYRERFAMENGTMFICNNCTCIEFIYSSDIEYQDANGAMYSLERKTWVN